MNAQTDRNYLHSTLDSYYDLDARWGLFNYDRVSGATGVAGTATAYASNHDFYANRACNFDGSSSAFFVGVASTDPSNSPATTISLWVNPSTTDLGYPANRVIALLSDGFNNSTCTSYSLFYNYSNNHFLIGNWSMNTSIIYSYSTNAYTPGQWYHIVLIFDKANSLTSLYVDNTLDISIAQTLVPPVAPALYVGEHNIFGWNYSGDMDELRLHKKALSTSEIDQLYQDDLIGYYPLANVWPNLTAIDESGFESHLNGSQVWNTSDRNANANEAVDMPWGDNLLGPGNLENNPDQVQRHSSSIWVYPYESSGIGMIYQVSDGSTLPSGYINYELLYDYDNEQFIVGYFYNSSYTVFQYSSGTYPQGTWHHAVVTTDVSTGAIELYVDNALDLSFSAGISAPVIAATSLGGMYLPSWINSFQGALDAARFYNKIISSTDVSALYGHSYDKKGTTTGTADLAYINEDEIKVFPNPAKDKIYINRGTHNDEMTITIFNQLGEKVLVTTLKNINSKTEELDVHTLSSGVYFMEIAEKNTMLVQQKKLVIR